MFSFQVHADPPVLKLTVLGAMDERELDQILALFEKARKRFEARHQVWFVLPLELERLPDLLFLKTRLESLKGRSEGFDSVVIEMQGFSLDMQAVAAALWEIFAELHIPVRVSRSHAESLSALKSLRESRDSLFALEPSLPSYLSGPLFARAQKGPSGKGRNGIYHFQTLKAPAVLKLVFHSTPSESVVNEILDRFCESRKHFPSGYQVWLVLPSHVGVVPQNAYRKADLEAFRGKTCGLRNVVIEVQGKDPVMMSVAGKLRDIYVSLGVTVQIEQDHVEARRALGMLWSSSVF